MPYYNVMVPTVALVEADDSETAIQAFAQLVRDAGSGRGFDVYEDPDREHTNAFETDGDDVPGLSAARFSAGDVKIYHVGT